MGEVKQVESPSVYGSYYHAKDYAALQADFAQITGKIAETAHELTELRSENERLREEDHTGYLIDRINEFARDMGYFNEDCGTALKAGDFLRRFTMPASDHNELTKLRKVVESVYHDIKDLPELHPCNYDHDDVCVLNAGMCNIHNFLYEKLGKAAEQAKESEGEG